MYFFFFFFNDTATTEIYTLSLHDALPIWVRNQQPVISRCHTPSGGDRLSFIRGIDLPSSRRETPPVYRRSEEHTSELQSLTNLVCRLLLEKKNKNSTRSSR